MADTNEGIQVLLARLPESQRQAAGALLAQYGPRLFELTDVRRGRSRVRAFPCAQNFGSTKVLAWPLGLTCRMV
jgi:hypothetical protein